MPAHSMRILLEANGIDAQVHGDFSAEIAGEVLVPEWTCDCGATVDEGFQVCWSCGQACPDDE